MKILFSIPYGSKLVLSDEHAGILTALCGGVIIREEGYGKDRRYVQAEDPPTVEFVREVSFEDLPTPLVELQKRAEISEKRWLEEYNLKNAEKKRADELQKKLDSIQGAVAA